MPAQKLPNIHVEAEDFASYGGWVLDSPCLLA